MLFVIQLDDKLVHAYEIRAEVLEKELRFQRAYRKFDLGCRQFENMENSLRLFGEDKKLRKGLVANLCGRVRIDPEGRVHNLSGSNKKYAFLIDRLNLDNPGKAVRF